MWFDGFDKLTVGKLTTGGKNMETDNQNLIAIVKSQEEFLREVGLWTGEASRSKYGFRLSPDSLEITASQRMELTEINDLVYSEGGFLDGSMELFRQIFNPRFTSTKVGGRISRALRMGIPRQEGPIQRSFQTQIPAIAKLDLALACSGPAFRILEVEADQAHGFGYVTIADRFGIRTFPNKAYLPGLITVLGDSLVERGFSTKKPLALIVGRLESFYEQELEVFSGIANKEGLNIMFIPERELVVSADGVASHNNRNSVTDLLVDLPILTSAGRIGTGVDSVNLLDLYAQAKIECLIPPKRFLSNKNLLGLISNGSDDQDLEKVLLDVFNESKLSRLRRFIPVSAVINRKTEDYAALRVINNPDNWVIKKAVASGSKGVALPSSPDRQRAFLQEALVNPHSYIIQEKVEQEARRFHFAEQSELGDLRSALMYMRLTLFASPIRMAALALTARETEDVHGAKDCIQIPVVYVKGGGKIWE